jgi:type IV pilus assembly protein PilA
MLKQLRSQKGLTLVELMVVVAIIAIIAAVAITAFQGIQKKARLAADTGTVASLRSGVAIYYGKYNGRFPPSDAVLETLVTPTPTWQCTKTYSYDTGNGRVEHLATTSDDCP